MRTVERILFEVKKLSLQDRRELLDKLREELAGGDADLPDLTPEERSAIAHFTDQPRWTPPAGPSVVELLRADRER